MSDKPHARVCVALVVLTGEDIYTGQTEQTGQIEKTRALHKPQDGALRGQSLYKIKCFVRKP